MIWRLLNALDRRKMRRLGGNHLNTLYIYGGYRCRHRSHYLRLRCLRHWTMDSWCGKHNEKCWDGCA